MTFTVLKGKMGSKLGPRLSSSKVELLGRD